jgi:hypothetical protein
MKRERGRQVILYKKLNSPEEWNSEAGSRLSCGFFEGRAQAD